MGIMVQEFINKLTEYAALSPENANAEIMLKFDGDVCFEFSHADDARGMPGQHFLLLIPNERGRRFGLREVRDQ